MSGIARLLNAAHLADQGYAVAAPDNLIRAALADRLGCDDYLRRRV
ncbi:hypothetical protein GO986_20605 [Deinococcus sp. HMF7620]|uniref:Uncharacterized protein n=1 Tax=Deinococcus arboris TaxID=2682977 RepID=A0A7C9MBH9_9DEIO|nr:hypothetical protein [Deinococcus arboris]MVN89143.1 hypothetical protein [Deinococcus arboris]